MRVLTLCLLLCLAPCRVLGAGDAEAHQRAGPEAGARARARRLLRAGRLLRCTTRQRLLWVRRLSRLRRRVCVWRAAGSGSMRCAGSRRRSTLLYRCSIAAEPECSLIEAAQCAAHRGGFHRHWPCRCCQATCCSVRHKRGFPSSASLQTCCLLSVACLQVCAKGARAGAWLFPLLSEPGKALCWRSTADEQQTGGGRCCVVLLSAGLVWLQQLDAAAVQLDGFCSWWFWWARS